MKKKLFNYIILILIFLLLLFRVINYNLYNYYNNILNYITILIVVIVSLYFTIKLKLIQFNILKIINALKNSTLNDLKALFMSMGAKIGVGSIAGISLAIYLSGPGVILWIWIWSFLASVLTYCESYLGAKYKNKNNQGGAFYYISKCLNNKNLAIIYTIILIFIYAIGFIGIQSNTIVKSIDNIININHYLIVIPIVIIIALIIFNNINSIINFMSKLVPVMCLLYLILGTIIILNSDYNIKATLDIIIKDAFTKDTAILSVIVIALQRGIFATESGIGTASIASSISTNTPHIQGIFQVIGTHFTSLVIVTITAFVIISSQINYTGKINGIEIVMSIFNNHYGLVGSLSLSLIIILFAVSTIVSGYYYSAKGIEFIKGNLTPNDTFFLKVLILILTFLGGVVESTIIWSMIDSLILFLLIINIYTIIKLRNDIS